MSEPKLISPLLDGFAMGNPMSDHDGVRCCPAIKENSDNKYIVKIISIPASQVQMDALLLTGAYRDPADAMNYFFQLGQDVMQEAELLKTLSHLDGFLPYEGWQMEPITKGRLGYEVYLVSSYKRSLEKHVRRCPMTHLDAINLGLDLCSALSSCRQAGALYVDLKPSNIFISEKKEYRIGDLGFIRMDALKYTALPEKYRSSYTPPELYDPMASLDLTVDTYAVGMILYQLYNDGQLPFKEKVPEEILPTPVNADYELAEIIMKAIHPEPAQRWSNPQEMGHALVAYMQRNSVNDVPITPHTPLEIPADNVPAAEPEAAAVPEATAAAEPVTEAPESSGGPTSEPSADETAPSEADARSVQPHEMSDELSRIISKADDLIAHETPAGVVVPEIPEAPDPFAFATEDSEEADDSDIPRDPVMPEPPEKEPKKTSQHRFASKKGKKLLRKLLSTLITLMILAGIALGAFWYYQNFYLQTIDRLSIDGDKNQFTVTIESDIDSSLLTVICSDTYGNTTPHKAENGKATFTGLRPNTMYQVHVQIEGFHKLVGQTSDIFTTDATTNIVSFTAAAGADNGSVMLNFTVDGEEPDLWTVRYQASGEEEQHKTFSGHSVTLSGLSIGKVYTFTLDAGEDLSLSGSSTTDHMVSRLILAQNLTITSSGGNDMTIHWDPPGDIVVESWNVRCYSTNGFEEKRTVTDTQVYLTGIDFTSDYTVEVTADGMVRPASTGITANPINITAFQVDDSESGKLKLTWEHSNELPEGGWLLMYTIDGSEGSRSVVKCDKSEAVITPVIPDAAYTFTLQAANGTSVFTNVHSHETAEAPAFNANGLSAEDMELLLVKTPAATGWRYEKLEAGAATDQFQVGDRISLVLHGKKDFYLPGSEMNLLYVIRDAFGNVLAEHISQGHNYWKQFWSGGDYHYGELDVPSLPEYPGTFELELYLNGAKVGSTQFTLTD